MRALLIGALGVFALLYNIWMSGRSKYEFRRRYARRHIATSVLIIGLAVAMAITGNAG